MDYSVVIATYNRRELLQRTLEALRLQSMDPQRFEVIVIDDGSSDGTAESLASLHNPRLRVISQSNRGPAAARNRGIREACGAWVVLTDDDTVPAPDWLEQVERAGGQHPDWVGVEGSTICSDPDPLGHWVENLRGRQFITANMAYRRQLLLDLGGLDESFPHPKCEDTELAWRCLQHGPIGFWPEMRIEHPNRSQSLASLLKSSRYDLSEFRLHRKLGADYRKFRRFGNPWLMLALIYLVVPWFRAWRFRSQLWGTKGAVYLLVHASRPFFFLYYWMSTAGSTRP
ncbi:glycosyltransferase family 2 protein [bacterium]|nr:glycosyltransferase family 2 protein [bacterium]